MLDILLNAQNTMYYVIFFKRRTSQQKRKINNEVSFDRSVEGQTRRRFKVCCGKMSEAYKNNIPLCKDCFMLYHVLK